MYRGQFIAPSELNRLKENVGGLVLFNTFISTSVDRDVVMLFLDTQGNDRRFEAVLFEYIIDPSIPLSDASPFADISHLSQMPDEGEVLISIGLVARIESISNDETFPRVQSIRLRFDLFKDTILNEYQRSLFQMLEKTGGNEDTYIGHLPFLILIGGGSENLEQFSRLVLEYSNSPLREVIPLINVVYSLRNYFYACNRLDENAFSQLDLKRWIDPIQNYDAVRKFPPLQNFLDSIATELEFSLNPRLIFQQDTPIQTLLDRLQSFVVITDQFVKKLSSSPELGPYCFLIQKMLTAYFEIFKENLKSNDMDSAFDGSFLSAALTRAIVGEPSADQAGSIEENERAIYIRRKAIERSTSDIIRAHHLDELADLYVKRKDWSAVITCCTDLLQLSSLPPNSLKIISAHENIGIALEEMGLFNEALYYYQRGLDLYQKHYANKNIQQLSLQIRTTSLEVRIFEDSFISKSRN